jgi:hypothetical protein
VSRDHTVYESAVRMQTADHSGSAAACLQGLWVRISPGAYRLPESANVKVHYRVNAATSDMGTINSSDRMAATLYSLGTLFVSGIYV